LEKLGVEKILIELTSRLTEPVQIGESLKIMASVTLNRKENRLAPGWPYFGDRLAGESVVGGIDTDGWENLGYSVGQSRLNRLSANFPRHS
jgi:hypothetical protein